MAKAGFPIERVPPPRMLVKLANPVVRGRIGRSRALQDIVLVLHFTGRRTGELYDVPVGYSAADDRLMVVTNSAWRRNFEGGREIEITFKGQRRPALALLVSDPEQVAHYFERQVAEVGVKEAPLRMGLRINLGRPPTRAEWLEAIDRERLTLIDLRV
jgi:hypothetical protein